ncbi:hypothetical protein [Colwellia sp. Bg11-28]|uniref:hypothetical protein n=1 Tax=Colwellia sp. Bg11-28 TaxID=2058305 RepID=UPI000C3437CD|nr:hypothetical protein [Colwellia sp. Bg11-28]PKH88854.1 hypothetical protein CXF79_02920 [Colwellia sp. Bg11-28]
MSKVIQVLAQIASDALLINQDSLTKMLLLAEISQNQKESMIAMDIDALTDSIHDLPDIKCFPIVIPEDEEHKTSIINQHLINFKQG